MNDQIKAIEDAQQATHDTTQHVLSWMREHQKRERDERELIGAVAHICRTLDRIDAKLDVLLTHARLARLIRGE